MRISSKGRLAIGIVGILAVAGIVMWWAMQQGQLPRAPAVMAEVKKDEAARVEENKKAAVAAAKRAEIAKQQAAEKGDTSPDVDPNDPPKSSGPKTWEDQLDDILLADDNENSKADNIINLMQISPPEAQEELAQHLVNMVQDDHYETTSNLLVNVNTSTNVADILINDLLNRNNTLKLNMLLAVMETPDHPMKDNAKEMLELFVQDDHGQDNKSWEKAVADWLKENEPAPQAQATTPDAPAPQ